MSTYEYGDFVRWFVLSPIFFAVLVIVAVTAPVVGGHELRTRGIILFAALCLIVGVLRRAANPIQFDVLGGVLRGTYLGKRRRDWPLSALRVKREWTFALDGSMTVRQMPGAEVAFQMYRDLPGYKSMLETIQRGSQEPREDGGSRGSDPMLP